MGQPKANQAHLTHVRERTLRQRTLCCDWTITGADIAIRDHRRSSNVLSGVRGPPDQGESGLGGTDGQVGNTMEGFRRSHYFLDLPQRQKQGPITQQDHLRTEFYKHYQREAADYDKEFMKKYDDDLNTTLIFVRLAHCPNVRSLTRTAGRFVFRCDFRIYRLGPSGTQA